VLVGDQACAVGGAPPMDALRDAGRLALRSGAGGGGAVAELVLLA
jgi:hypothetical protein